MNIHYTILEGAMYKHDVKKSKKKKKTKDGESIQGDISGKWDVTVDVPGDEQSVQLIFTKKADEYSGILIDDEGEETTLEDISIEGNSLTFSFKVENEGMELNMDVSAEIDGETLQGNVRVGEFGTFPLEGSKLTSPKN